MKGTLSKDRRISIPLNIVNEAGFIPGMPISIKVENNKIIIEKFNEQEDIEDKLNEVQKDLNKSKQKEINSTKPTSKNIIIKSNIEDKNKYSRPYLSECGLVVRSKTRYIREFCEVCQGQLCNTCKYSVNKNNKPNITKDIQQNVKILNNKIDNKIKQTKFHDGNTTLQPVIVSNTNKLIPCECCGQLFNSGFLLNEDQFYCTECVKKDFKNYVQLRGNN